MLLSPLVRLRRFYYKLRFEVVERTPPFKESMASGQLARKRGDWVGAAEHFVLAAKARPDSVGAKLHLGHAYKATGRLEEAERCYRAAVKLAPDGADVHIQLGHALKLLGRRAEAADSYARAVSVAPRDEIARAELVALGARDRLGSDQYGSVVVAKGVLAVRDEVDILRDALRDLARAAVFPPQAWHDFRLTFTHLPPDDVERGVRKVCVVIDARGARPSFLRATLTSLIDQTARHWQAIVLADATTLEHSVASMGYVDRRIEFVEATPDLGASGDDLLMLKAGVVLSPQALDWLVVSAVRANAAALYCDHDHCLSHAGVACEWKWPALHDAPGRYDLRSTPVPPALCYSVAPHSERTLQLLVEGDVDSRLHLLNRLEAGERVVHLPLVLASRQLDASEDGPPVIDSLDALEAAGSETAEARIRVVIPTRDQAAILESCIRSLEQTADRPDLLSIIVLDNRSVEPETHALLQTLTSTGAAEVVRVDEPFNWARFNNLGVRDSAEELFVFANNDLEMLSAGWDRRLRVLLADQAVGAVGARLLYPDRTLQHVGIVLGAISGRPVHEGRGAGPREGGPLSRWRRTREAAAVTGAFLAVRRDAFATVDGFNERLAIAYNDVDFCLRIREAGLSVIFAADIEAVHYESKTRGYAYAQEKVAWDDAEFGDLCRIWGDRAVIDPIVNPHWTFAEERSFDGLQHPPLSRMLR